MKSLLYITIIIASILQAVYAGLPNGVIKLADIPYGNSPQQTMDVYKTDGVQNAPVIFMVHGGAWRIGDKESHAVLDNKIKRWVPAGFIFISINYRMLPEADPLVQLQDVAKALATAQEKAQSWGGDPEKFIVMGHSAGAHLVGLLAASPSIGLKVGAQKWLGNILLDTAALDVTEIMKSGHMRFYDDAFGKDPEFWKMASPVNNLSAEAYPMLVICSSRRKNSCNEARVFTDQAKSLGIKVSMLEQDMTHRQINQELGLPGAYTNHVEDFMRNLDARVNSLLSSNK